MTTPDWLYAVDDEVVRLGRSALGLVLSKEHEAEMRAFYRSRSRDPQDVNAGPNMDTAPIFYRGLFVSVGPVSAPLVIQAEDGS